MKIGERMVSRADDEIDLFLVDIRLLAIETDLPAPLIVTAIAREHREVTVRCLVMEWLSEFGNMFRPQSGEGSSHTRFPESRREISMAAGANGRVHIAIFRMGGGTWQAPLCVNPRRHHSAAQYHRSRHDGYRAPREDHRRSQSPAMIYSAR